MAYIHIDDDIAPYLEILIDCIKLRGKDIEKQIKRITEDSKLMEDCLEEEFLGFKLHAKKIRDEYEKAVTEEIEKSEKIWEKCDALINDSKPSIQKCLKEISALKEEVSKVDKALNSIHIYKVEKMIELVQKVNGMSESDKKLLFRLLEIDREK